MCRGAGAAPSCWPPGATGSPNASPRSYGSEDKLATLMGVMQALVSFLQDEGNSIRCARALPVPRGATHDPLTAARIGSSIHAGNHRFVFQVRGPLILVAVARTLESDADLQAQLSAVYNQILSVLTQTQLFRIFEQRRNYDLRRLLAGTEKFIDALLLRLDLDVSFMLSSVRCLPLSHQCAEAAADAASHVLVAVDSHGFRAVDALSCPRPQDAHRYRPDISARSSQGKRSALCHPDC